MKIQKLENVNIAGVGQELMTGRFTTGLLQLEFFRFCLKTLILIM